MPPEPFPYERRDFFKERKHESSEFSTSSSLGSVAPPPPSWRWRGSSSSSSSSGNYNNAGRDFARWGPHGFRGRPPGRGWHLFEESGSPRSGEKMVGDDNFRFSAAREGKYGGSSSMENKVSFNPRDWRPHLWHTNNGSSQMLGWQSDVTMDQKSGDGYAPHPPSIHSQSDSISTCDQPQSEDHKDIGKMGSAHGLVLGRRANSLDWKPLTKWSRSGSISSRGLGFSHSSSSKSLGDVDSNDGKTEPQHSNISPPSGDAMAYATSMVPSEETAPRKKARLGWGEGLAKYEKKKIEVPDLGGKKVELLDLGGKKDGLVFSCSLAEPNTSQCLNLAERSPRVLGFSDCASPARCSNLADRSTRVMGLSNCASPATPSSVACSSSPGVEEKTFFKEINIDHDISNLCGSPSIVSHGLLEGSAFNLEKLDIVSLANLGCSLASTLQADEMGSGDSAFILSTTLSKLLVLKAEVSKDLEVTESKIDSLENELKSLKFKSRTKLPCLGASSSLLAEGNVKVASDNRSSPSPIVPCEKERTEKILSSDCSSCKERGRPKYDDNDSPGTATSKFVELVSFNGANSVSHMVKQSKHSSNLDVNEPAGAKQKCLEAHTDGEYGVNCCMQTENKSAVAASVDGEDNLCGLIIAFNNESASKAVEVFNKLFTRDPSKIDFSELVKVSSQRPDVLIEHKVSARKRLLRFKERVLALKFKVLQKMWNEDVCALSMHKFHSKSQKKSELSLRSLHNVTQKHQAGIRLHLSSPGGMSNVFPTKGILSFTGKLLSNSQNRPYRNALKMPALILDEKDKLNLRFVSNNGLVEDPCAVESERALVNAWTPEEKELFIDKLAFFGKDFSRIASFLDHKTTADCVEFYYKNHKSDCFEKIKKKKQVKTNADYLVGVGKRWSREVNAASLDVFGAASVIAADVDNVTRGRQTFSGRIFLTGCIDSKAALAEGRTSNRRNIEFGSERETVATDVLAGICGSVSSEALSSCITTSLDLGEGYWEQKCQRVDAVMKRSSTSELTQNVDEDTCSDESSGELDPSDWTDKEKSIFLRAVSSYGNDFAMISRYVKTRSMDQCKVFFSKAKKCLGLDEIHPKPGNLGTPLSDDVNGDGSDREYMSALEFGSVNCGAKLRAKMDPDSPLAVVGKKQHQDGLVWRTNLPTDLNGAADASALDEEASEALFHSICQSDQRPELASEEKTMDDVTRQSNPSRVLCETSPAEGDNNEVPERSVSVAGSMLAEKPLGNHDVKLFGQILCNTSAMENVKMAHICDIEENGICRAQRGNNTLKVIGYSGLARNVSVLKVDHSNHPGVEGKSMTDKLRGGASLRTGYPSLSDVAIVQSKYSSILGNYQPASKMEHKSLHAAVISNNLNLNSILAFHPREIASGNGLVDCQSKAHPFTIDMKQHHDEGQKRNGFQVNPQQQHGRVAGMNIVGRGGILVGSPCPDVTDAMLAIRRHFTKAEQYNNVKTGSVFREDGSWRGKEDIGR